MQVRTLIWVVAALARGRVRHDPGERGGRAARLPTALGGDGWLDADGWNSSARPVRWQRAVVRGSACDTNTSSSEHDACRRHHARIEPACRRHAAGVAKRGACASTCPRRLNPLGWPSGQGTIVSGMLPRTRAIVGRPSTCPPIVCSLGPMPRYPMREQVGPQLIFRSRRPSTRCQAPSMQRNKVARAVTRDGKGGVGRRACLLVKSAWDKKHGGSLVKTKGG